MNILYYTWQEITKEDAIEQLERMGHVVDCIEYPLKDFLSDSQFFSFVEEKLKRRNYDGIFTFNYVPIISKIAFRNQLPYIAWIYDSPCFTLYSDTIFNPYNYIFHFDSFEVELFRHKGVKQIWHMPLAVNTNRIDRVLSKDIQPNQRLVNDQVSFMGSLYADKYNLLDQIKYLPEYEKGFLQGMIDTQLGIFGYDLIGDLLTNDKINDLLKYIRFDLDEELFISAKEALSFMIKKKATVVERKELIEMIGRKFQMTLYSPSDTSGLSGIECRGPVRYMDEMPIMFHNSAINLNITLRTIQNGISLRAMDIMGAGGFLLSNYQPELAEFFTEGEEMAMYSSREDLLFKIQYYLSHEDERMKIAEHAKKKVEQEYTYQIQFSKIFDTVF